MDERSEQVGEEEGGVGEVDQRSSGGGLNVVEQSNRIGYTVGEHLVIPEGIL